MLLPMTKTPDDGLTLALRCLQAMEGQDELTRRSLWAAAKRYAARDRGERTGGGRSPLPFAATDGAMSVGLARTDCL